jgi:hypothetical protein
MQVVSVGAALGGTALAVAAATALETDVQAGGGVAIGIFPGFAGVGTGQTVTAQIVRTDTGAVIGTSVGNAGAAGAANGPLVVIAPIPAGMAGGIALQFLSSAAVGTISASAAQPVTLITLP